MAAMVAIFISNWNYFSNLRFLLCLCVSSQVSVQYKVMFGRKGCLENFKIDVSGHLGYCNKAIITNNYE